ncbi:MAG: hydroxyacid dehydrogenase [Deltaproteobacteria bacterium]|jgi:D-3-phosphoglycerate dehydrogenase|nr:hydroxyacid dehydrogenase [Deltaproteobacteria bacterium]MBW2534259.1 hydroxyacid dehydrogenase [Deltaproteobacteria bacterium]
MLILISDAFDPSLPGRLQQFGEVTDDKGRLPEAEVVLIRSKTKCTREYLDGAPKLKLIVRGGVGLDNVDQEYAKEKGIAVHNTPDASSVAVAELALALMLAVPNNVVPGHNGMREGKWLKKELKRTELFKKTLGLLGIGRIGTEVAKRCQAFGMDIIAYDPFVESHDVAQLKSLDEVLAQSDYLSMHMPLTDETKGMINADSIAKMKKGVIIVNTGRGKCVDEQALTKALADGQVRSYATDVWPSDPPPDDCPLTKAPNVLMTPHIGASSKENLLRIGDIVEQKIRDHVAQSK